MGNRHHSVWTTRRRHRGADIAHGAWTSRTSHHARRPREMRDVVSQGARQVREVRGKCGRCAVSTQGARQVREVRGEHGSPEGTRESGLLLPSCTPRQVFSQPDMSGVQFGNDRQPRERGGVRGRRRRRGSKRRQPEPARAQVTAAAPAPTDLVPTAQTVHGLCEPRPGCVSRGRSVRGGWEPALSSGGGLLAHRRRGGPAFRGRRAHCGTAPANRRRPAPRGAPGPVRRSPTSRSS
ncbi:MAG: hypothetical protein QOI75_5620 [Pseudonocardiales bacterium]|nr:hypothetical protein [Pseudonocardiales bacterium]